MSSRNEAIRSAKQQAQFEAEHGVLYPQKFLLVLYHLGISVSIKKSCKDSARLLSNIHWQNQLWLIPKDAEKPVDKRKREENGK